MAAAEITEWGFNAWLAASSIMPGQPWNHPSSLLVKRCHCLLSKEGNFFNLGAVAMSFQNNMEKYPDMLNWSVLIRLKDISTFSFW
jgi:hypothetical protein